MKNQSLKNDLKEIVKDKGNIVKVYKGIRGEQATIEIEEKELKGSPSYLYKKEADRDMDFEQLEALLK